MGHLWGQIWARVTVNSIMKGRTLEEWASWKLCASNEFPNAQRFFWCVCNLFSKKWTKWIWISSPFLLPVQRKQIHFISLIMTPLWPFELGSHCCWTMGSLLSWWFPNLLGLDVRFEDSFKDLLSESSNFSKRSLGLRAEAPRSHALSHLLQNVGAKEAGHYDPFTDPKTTGWSLLPERCRTWSQACWLKCRCYSCPGVTLSFCSQVS